jgi:phosphatidate cytidylyltransferase
VLAALVFAPALLGIIWVGGLYLSVTCFVISLLMLWEYLRLAMPQEPVRLKIAAYMLTAVVAAAVLGWLPPNWLAVLPPLVLLAVLCSVLFQPDPIAASMQRAGLTMLGVFYCGSLFPLLSALRDGGANGKGLSLMALFCTWAADTGAYFAGRA